MESKSSSFASLKYHDIFNYPLTSDEIKKWQVGKEFTISNLQFPTNEKQNFHFINGRQNIIKTRIQNEKYSKKKLKIAKEAAKTISRIPTVLFVGITGSLAMMNAKKDSDIDLLIITKSEMLWISRLLVYCLLVIGDFSLRKPRVKNERDTLCLNMWLDETDLVWDKKDRNIYTAHEIAQVVPLVNKNKIYKRFLNINKWILNYWPNSVKIRKSNIEYRNKLEFSKIKYLNIVSNFVLRTSNFPPEAGVVSRRQFIKTQFFGFFQPDAKLDKLIAQNIRIWGSSFFILGKHICQHLFFIFFFKIQFEQRNT